MSTYKITARIVGLLFLTAIITDTLGSELIESILLAPSFLVNASVNSNEVILGVILDLICCAAVLGIGVLMFPILKKFNRNMALSYLGFRIIEPAIMVVILISSIALLTLSQEYVKAGAPDASYYQTLGSIFQAQRYWGYLMYIIIFSFGASIFYYALFKYKLIPRFISIWGLIGVAIMLIGTVFAMFGHGIDMIIYGTPMGLNELFLGIWLIVKGFNSTVLASESVKTK